MLHLNLQCKFLSDKTDDFCFNGVITNTIYYKHLKVMFVINVIKKVYTYKILKCLIMGYFQKKKKIFKLFENVFHLYNIINISNKFVHEIIPYLFV